MYIYKIINTINGRWYIGKTNGRDPNYMGSGKLLKQAYAKYGQENFIKEVLETCSSDIELNLREQHWIATTNATSDHMSYNLATGGQGGDLSKFIDYKNRKPSDNFAGRQKWYNALSADEKKDLYTKQAENRTKGWYVSCISNPTETYVQNISKWCEENGVDKSMPTALNNPNHRLFQKQTKGWRIRRADMPTLSSYKNLRGKTIIDNGCTGKTWKLVEGKRIWCDK